jgi:hypothetical protein
MGTGRSGTTILEILLKNNPDFFGAGELTYIFRDGFIQNKECSCGSLTTECAFWKNIKKEFTLNEILLNRTDFEYVAKHWIFPFLFLNLARKKRLMSYIQNNEKLFLAIKKYSGCNTIIDSSKYPGRALTLAQYYPAQIKILCITRSPGGLLAAFKKRNEDEQKPKSNLMAAIYYLYVTACMFLVKYRFGKICYSIRFEELRGDPIGTLTKIQQWSGYNLSGSIEKIYKEEMLDVGHIVTGNRLRKNRKIKYQSQNIQNVAEMDSNNILHKLLTLYRRVLGF